MDRIDLRLGGLVMQKQHKTALEKAHTGRLSCLWQKVCLALSFVFIILILVGVLGLNLFSGSFTTNDALSSGALNSSSYLRVVLWLMPDSVTSGDRVYYVEENPDHDETENSGDGIAVFSEIYYPDGWQVTIDGQKAELGRADYILRTLYVPAGKHTIEMRFDPQSLHVTEGIAYGAFILLLIGVIAVVWMERRKCAKEA